MSMFSPELQGEVAMRIAVMDRTAPEVIREVEQVMERKLSAVINQELAAAGGVKSLVDILNFVDRATERTILDSLDDRDQELGEDVRKLMFVFEDLLSLDDRAIQQLLKEIEIKDVGLALKGAGEEVREKIFGNMSSRAAQMLLEDMEFMGPVRRRIIEEAQGRIVSVVRRLEESGQDHDLARQRRHRRRARGLGRVPERPIIARAQAAGTRRLAAVTASDDTGAGTGSAGGGAAGTRSLGGMNQFLERAREQGAALIAVAREQAEAIAQARASRASRPATSKASHVPRRPSSSGSRSPSSSSHGRATRARRRSRRASATSSSSRSQIAEKIVRQRVAADPEHDGRRAGARAAQGVRARRPDRPLQPGRPRAPVGARASCCRRRSAAWTG